MWSLFRRAKVPSEADASSFRGLDRRVTAVLAVVLLVLAVGGLASGLQEGEGGSLAVFGFDAEFGVAALVSSVLLLGAAGSNAYSLQSGRAHRSLFFFPGFLAFMAVDEYMSLHERLEATTGVDWQVLYAPLIAAAAVAWFRVVWLWRDRRTAALLLLGGAACWGVSQLLEILQWDGDVQRPNYVPMSVVEELLEAAGSAMLLLAGLASIAVVQSAHGGRTTPD